MKRLLLSILERVLTASGHGAERFQRPPILTAVMPDTLKPGEIS